nr:rna polymerase ii transcription factor b subunit 4 [Quercus suber]
MAERWVDDRASSWWFAIKHLKHIGTRTDQKHYLSPTVFPTDLHSRTFLQLPKSVDECFCHKKTIDMGYICSVSLSIFCKHHKKCSTCGSVFGQAQSDVASTSNLKRKTPKT